MSIKTCIFGLLALGLSFSASSAVINGDFSAGLTGWIPLDDVTESSGNVRVGDDSPWGISTLYQVTGAELGSSIFEFDFYSDLVDFDPFNEIPDIFSVSLYFSNDSSLDLFTYEAIEWLFDADAMESFVNQGTLGASNLGDGWQHFQFEFENIYSYVMPVFDLYDSNFEIDSHVFIDNVNLSLVPVFEVSEPHTLVLMLLGLILLVATHSKRRV